MIRPSALQLAESCGLSARLAEQYPEQTPEAERGTAIHDAIARGDREHSPEAAAALAYLDGIGEHDKEVLLCLRDANGMEVTRGTADVVSYGVGGSEILVIDWKTGRPENVAHPDDNLQLHAYGLAAADAAEVDTYRVAIGFIDGDKLTMVVGELSRAVAEGDDKRTMRARVERAAAMDATARPGPHCGKCYSRWHCPSHIAGASPGEGLEVLAETGVATAEKVLRLHVAAKAMEDIVDRAKVYVRHWVEQNGPLPDGAGKELALIPVAGKRSVSVADAEKVAPQIIKQGQPTTRLDWRKVR